MKCPAITMHNSPDAPCAIVRCEATVAHDEHWGGDGVRWKSTAELDEGVAVDDDGFYTVHATKPLDSIKSRWDLIPWEQLRAVERVLTHGLSKHGSEFGWKQRTRAEHVQALLRHVVEYAMGKRFDEDTKQPVLAHVVARALFVMFHDGEVLP